MFFVILFALASTIAAHAQPKWNVTQTPEVPKANEKVIIEVTELTSSPALQIDWTKRKGDGNFDGDTTKKRVTFIPAKPGDVVIIVCNVTGPWKTEIEHTILVAAASDSAPVRAAAVPAQQPPTSSARTERAPAQQLEPLPEGSVPLDKLIDPNTGIIMPSGYMADANTSVVSLVGGRNCKFDAGCYAFQYNLAERKEGWAGFAWQMVPQGKKWNWGEHKGLDLSNRGFRSFRVWAQIEPGGPIPKVRVEFKSGGNVEPQYSTTNRATYIVSSGLFSVDEKWKQVCLNLERSDLRNVVSPFTVVLSGAFNPPDLVRLNLDGASYSMQPCPAGTTR